ncbi:uncharacterized protein C8Q71DRAFT_763407 [Rhodofomes roseus]|uniref:Uncharacterized protein n=1 Tax=Rhodofomes roseus TaxID=34475 RepID=A0A4Y9Z2J6_9APHY|nr:uncharacterized protein C8Q71DRAFT_763407 [Rhodofomes roseus]KAH9835784.1 hypothetical protein C8Q71DRAFT_763407 [Rhodofomes roseus]TFY69066.1 hypothetical protein EVJ58_g651 [Rhodofomes roseus]
MAIMTMSAGPSALNPASVRPYASSPLVSNASSRQTRSLGAAPSFPVSRPLRPFPSIANTMSPGLSQRSGAQGGKRQVKIIEPPANTKCAFVLNLTQAEFSRQE